MKLHIEPTTRIVEIDMGDALVPARVWEGQTDNGIPVICLITRVAAVRDNDLSELEAALVEQRTPTFDGVQAFPNRLIL